MANKTVYPFGTDGQLPSSIGIINDLEHSDVDKALSANMGKVLNGKLQIPQDVTAFTTVITGMSFNAQDGFIAGDGGTKVWYLPVREGENYVVTATYVSGTTTFRVGFSQNVPAIGGAVSVAYVGVGGGVDEVANVVAPFDGYLVYRSYGNYYTIVVELLKEIKDEVAKIGEIYESLIPCAYSNAYLNTALDSSGTWQTATNYTAYHFNLENGGKYHINQQVHQYGNNNARIFQVTESGGVTTYTLVAVDNSNEFDYECPNDGNNYLIQLVYQRSYGGELPMLKKYTVTSKAVEDLASQKKEENETDKILRYDGHTSVECLNRFIQEMQTRIANNGYDGSTLTSPWGSSTNYLNIDALVKYTAQALSYNFLCELYAEATHTAETSVRTVTINSTTYTNQYAHYYTDNYIPLVHKTGSSGANANFTCACVEPNSGEILVGTIITSAYYEQSDSINRYKCMKILLDIGTLRLADPSADVSALEAELVTQKIVSAIVIRIPKCNPLAQHHLLVGNSPWLLYGYSRKSVLTFSTIKLLSAQIMMDYLADKLEYDIVVDADDATCAEVSGITLVVGEQWKVRDLIYAILLDSSNQATKAVAKRVGAILLDNY